MSRRVTKNIIGAKFKRFVASIKSETVRTIVEENSIITGGAIASLLLSEPVKDFDVYFRTHAAAAEVARYYVARFNEMHPDMKIKPIVKIGNRIKIVVQSAGITGEAKDDN
jgi:hypothetical protein